MVAEAWVVLLMLAVGVPLLQAIAAFCLFMFLSCCDLPNAVLWGLASSGLILVGCGCGG